MTAISELAHHRARAAVRAGLPTPVECARGVGRAALVEAESLSVLEMALRGYREIRVSATGRGIDAAIRDRIFDPLGLSISHGIVAAHDGRIEVESSPESTHFTVHLPLRPAPRPRRTTGVYSAR